VISLLVFRQNGVIMADVNTAKVEFSSGLVTGSNGITVSVDNQDRACLTRGGLAGWTITAQNDSRDESDVTLAFRISGLKELEVLNYNPSWQTDGDAEQAYLRLGTMAPGQISVFELSGNTLGDIATVAVSPSDSSGFIYNTWAGTKTIVRNSCK
jgi:hypothetical protein